MTYEEFKNKYIQIPKDLRKDFLWRYFKRKERLPHFGKFYFSHIIKGSYETPQIHKELIKEITARKNSAIIFPRGFAKTTWEKIDTIHDIVYQTEPVILYVSITQTDAQFHFESIKFELENNDLLRTVYGDLVPPDWAMSHKWTNRHLECSNGVNLVGRGAGKGRGVNIKNQRPTKIVLDDIEDDEAVRSPDRRAKLHDWITRVILPSLDKEKGFCKMIGTVLAPHCELLEYHRIYGGIFKRAIENGESTWPEFWSLEQLEKRKAEIGSRAFNSEYMNNPINDEDSIIKREWIDGNRYTTLPVADYTKQQKWNYVVMCDPQAGTSDKSDYYSICVVGYITNDRHRYVVSSTRGKDTQINQAAHIVRTVQSLAPANVIAGVEKVLTQVAVYQLILDWIAGTIDLPGVNNHNRNISFRAVSPEGKDKVERLKMHEASFERGEIHLHASHQILADQLLAFPNVEHDDDVDALLYSLEHSRMSNSSLGSLNTENLFPSILGDVSKRIF